MTYLSLNEYLRKEFGTKVYKLSLSSGCSCPNRDGTVGTGGCSFCSEGGSGEFASEFAPVKIQIQKAKEKVDAKFPKKISAQNRKYIAYFQSYTNTYAPVSYLDSIYREAISEPDVVALSVGTRPDCLGDDIIDMLSRLNCIKPVWIELGLQTIKEDTAKQINRGYSLDVFNDAYKRLKSAGLSVIVHLILGLPGESENDMLSSVEYLSSLSPRLDGIKLQNLQILKGTRIYEQYIEEKFHVFSLEEYCSLIVKCLKIIGNDIVVHRLTGDGPKSLLVQPEWSCDKKRVLNTMKSVIENS